ncbi:MAG: glycosyltransferase, partial [Anaerolineales bacterium]
MVFSDANNLYKPNVLRELVAPFSDPNVGAVTSAKVIVKGDSALGDTEGLYWKHESFICHHLGRFRRAARRGRQREGVNHLARAGDEAERDLAGARVYLHRAVVGIVTVLALRQDGPELVQASAARAVGEVGQPVNAQAFVQVVVPGHDGGRAPGLEGPLHPRRRAMPAGRVGRVVEVDDLPRLGGGGQPGVQPGG